MNRVVVRSINGACILGSVIGVNYSTMNNINLYRLHFYVDWYPQALFAAEQAWRKRIFCWKTTLEQHKFKFLWTTDNIWQYLIYIFVYLVLSTIGTNYLRTYVRTYRTICTYSTARSVHTVHTVHTAHTVHTVRSVHTVPYRAVSYRTVSYRTVTYCTVP